MRVLLKNDVLMVKKHPFFPQGSKSPDVYKLRLVKAEVLILHYTGLSKLHIPSSLNTGGPIFWQPQWIVKFSFSEKANKFWSYLPLDLMFTK